MSALHDVVIIGAASRGVPSPCTSPSWASGRRSSSANPSRPAPPANPGLSLPTAPLPSAGGPAAGLALLHAAWQRTSLVGADVARVPPPSGMRWSCASDGRGHRVRRTSLDPAGLHRAAGGGVQGCAGPATAAGIPRGALDGGEGVESALSYINPLSRAAWRCRTCRSSPTATPGPGPGSREARRDDRQGEVVAFGRPAAKSGAPSWRPERRSSRRVHPGHRSWTSGRPPP